jgi:hypothetical protein
MFSIYDALLAPLARLFVTRGERFADIAERLKGHYVQAALEVEADKATDSRLSLVTGLSRREVARLRAFEARPPKPNPLTRLVALWQTHPEYRDTPVLPRTGPAPSFEALARLVLQDVHPRTLLDTLLKTGTVEEKDGTLRLAKTAFVPASGSDEQVSYLVENVGDHMQAALENVLSDSRPHFERALHMTDLTPDQIDSLARAYEDGQMQLLRSLQARAEEMKAQDKGTMRMRIGGFFYRKGKPDDT